MKNRRFQIKIDGPPVKDGQISFDLLGRVLKGVQETIYYLALSDLQYDYRQRIRIPQNVKESCSIYRVVEDKGSYCLTAEIATRQQVGDIDDLGLAAKQKYLEVVHCLKNETTEALNNIIPDSNYRRKVLRSFSAYCPKSGDKWNLGIGDFDKPLMMLVPGIRKSIRSALIKPDFEHMKISGELVQLHLDENKLGLYYEPSQRVIHCTYEPDLEDFIVSNLRETIQVYGRVQMNNRGEPEKILDVLEIEEIDVSPMDISEIHVDGTVLVLENALSLPVEFDQEGQEFVLEYPEMGIVAGAENRDALFNEFCDDFYWVWQEYGNADTASMSQSALKLSQKLKEMVKEIKTA